MAVIRRAVDVVKRREGDEAPAHRPATATTRRKGCWVANKELSIMVINSTGEVAVLMIGG